VIFDRWYGAALGTPLLVDLCDCDVLLPAPYEVVPDTDPSTWPVDESFMALGEHLKLCILVGRVLKTIYSPTGLKHATDEQLESLIMDFETWFRDLPDQLRYKGPESSHNAGTSCHFSSDQMTETQAYFTWAIAPFNSCSGEYSCESHIHSPRTLTSTSPLNIGPDWYNGVESLSIGYITITSFWTLYSFTHILPLALL